VIPLILKLLLAHTAGDLLLQTRHMVEYKLTDPRVRARHVSVYTASFLPLVLGSNAGPVRKLLFLAAVWLPHFVVDSRLWVPGDKLDPLPVVVDQALHFLSLLAAKPLVDR
jgi:hypothetical protein